MSEVRQTNFSALDQNTRFSSPFLLRHQLVHVDSNLDI